MGNFYAFGAEGMPVPQLMPQPPEPIPLNPGYRRKIIPAKVVIDQMMKDRASFIGGFTEQAQEGEQ